MRVITPTGKLVKISKVIPYVEKYEYFNKRKQFVSEVAADLTVNPTALKFEIETNDNNVFLDASIFVGNLSRNMYLDIMDALLRDQYYDLSLMSYQDIKIYNLTASEVQLGEEFKPYYQENGLLFTTSNPAFTVVSGINSDEEENEDEEEHDTAEHQDA